LKNFEKGDWGDFPMLPYNRRLKTKARSLRTKPTDAELHLWHRLRRKQILGVQFYRQKPIANYIADFYAPVAKLVVELDGAQHWEPGQSKIGLTTDQGSGAARIESLTV
jgi:very-short-patch-repair endonuclease